MADNALLSRDEVEKIMGNSGTSHFNGYYTEEYNATWRDQQRVDTVEEMRRGDGTVKSILNALKAPILGAENMIEPFSDDKLDMQIRDEVEDQLYNMKGRSFLAFLKESLGCLDFGHSAFEKIWKIKDGKIKLIDLAPRVQSSIQSWKLTDGREGIIQISRNDENNTPTLEIPKEKLFVLTYDKEGDDITGQSVLRAAYIHWFMKNAAYKVQAIGIERHTVGIPVGHVPQGAGSQEIEEFADLLKNVRANQQQYLLLKDGYTFEIVTPNGNPMGTTVKDYIDHHDRHILLAVLAVFLDLGSGATGSFALSRDQSSFFLKHVEQFTRYIAEQIDEQIIKDIVDYNFPGVKRYPKFKFLSLGEIDFEEMSNVVERLTNSGYVSPNEIKDMNFVRKMFHLPEIEEKEMEKIKVPEVKEETKEDPKFEEFNEKKKPQFWRDLTEPEKRVDWVFLAEQYDTLEGDLEQELITTVKEGLDKGVNRIRNILKSGALPALAILTFLNKTQIKASLKKAITQAYEAGKKTAAKEIGVDRVATPTKDSAVLNYDAEVYATQVISSIEKAATETAKNGYAAEVATAAIIGAVITNANNAAAKSIQNTVGTVVGQNINRGRLTIFRKHSGLISGYQRSEIIDDRTCEICMSLDMRIIKADDPFLQMDSVHNSCRGSWIALKLDEFETQKEIIAKGVLGIPKTLKDQFETIGGVPVINNVKQLKKPINRSNEAVQNELKRRAK